MPSKLTIEESSGEPQATEYGGRIEELDSGRTTATASRRAVNEADGRKLNAVPGGSIERIRRPSGKAQRWFDDDRDNLLRVRQWVYEVILGAAVLVLLSSFLVIVIGSARHGKLDLPSFMGAIGTFLGGLGLGYRYRAQRGRRRRHPRTDDDGEQEKDIGDDTS